MLWKGDALVRLRLSRSFQVLLTQQEIQEAIEKTEYLIRLNTTLTLEYFPKNHVSCLYLQPFRKPINPYLPEKEISIRKYNQTKQWLRGAGSPLQKCNRNLIWRMPGGIETTYGGGAEGGVGAVGCGGASPTVYSAAYTQQTPLTPPHHCYIYATYTY